MLRALCGQIDDFSSHTPHKEFLSFKKTVPGRSGRCPTGNAHKEWRRNDNKKKAGKKRRERIIKILQASEIPRKQKQRKTRIEENRNKASKKKGRQKSWYDQVRNWRQQIMTTVTNKLPTTTTTTEATTTTTMLATSWQCCCHLQTAAALHIIKCNTRQHGW